MQLGKRVTTILLAGSLTACGCSLPGKQEAERPIEPSPVYADRQTEFSDPLICNEQADSAHIEELAAAGVRRIEDSETLNFHDLTLDDAIATGLQNSAVLKNLGGTVLSSPGTVQTVYNPAITEANPASGVEGALSAFDAQLAVSTLWSRNDQLFNNFIAGQGVNQFQQELGTFTASVTKPTATGARFSLQNSTSYDGNDASANLFPSAWTTIFQAEARQPLLQGAGISFNRIAGPQFTEGYRAPSGVLLARISSDVSLINFESGVVSFVDSIETAYWNLYIAYRNLETRRAARDSVLTSWRLVQARYRKGLRGGEALNETQARELYFVFQDEVENALAGGTGSGSVYEAERLLRRLIGLKNEDRLLRPVDSPPSAEVDFDWACTLRTALSSRPELRRQKWTIKQTELELEAIRSYTKPRLDAVARYRWRGLGDDLVRSGSAFPTDSAFGNLAGGDHQEWDMGFEFSLPVGFRRAHSALRHAELRLARGRAVLREQERLIASNLAGTITAADRSFRSIQYRLNRVIAAREHTAAAQTAFDASQATIDQVLQAEQRLVSATNGYFTARAAYGNALRDVELQTGSYLDSRNIYLREGPWPAQAHASARNIARNLSDFCMNPVQTVPAAIGVPSDAMRSTTKASPGLPVSESSAETQKSPTGENGDISEKAQNSSDLQRIPPLP